MMPNPRRSSGLLMALLAFVLAVAVGAPCRADEAPAPPPPPNASLNEQVIRIPVEEPPAVTLQVTIMHPDGNGPFPLAIMNHGAANVSKGHRGGRYHRTNAAFYFLSRGYAVALPMMRGFSSIRRRDLSFRLRPRRDGHRPMPRIFARSFVTWETTPASTPAASSSPARAWVAGTRWRWAR